MSTNLYNMPVDFQMIAIKNGRVHHIICQFKYLGIIEIQHKIRPNKAGVEVEGLHVEEAFFRGRKLEGLRVPVPDGYEGYVLGKKKNQRGKRKDSDSCDDDSNSWETCASFRNITYWNHDSFPSQNDAFLRCFHWFSVAEALHKPVRSEDIAGTTTHGSGKAE
ncbi:hypothetical protein Syun_010728 [Stephania yunnanensis]|uniref:Uncharacterized protein n=1 Tax=Stephania yunnanensis TaxID=152371 RepID=A0AAP0KIT5_9MAGN